MKIEKIKFDNVRYNPEFGAFEALVKIHDGDEVFSYPARVSAPLHAEYGLIVRGLMQAAKTTHKGGAGKMRMHHGAPSKIAASDASQQSLLTRLLGTAAA